MDLNRPLLELAKAVRDGALPSDADPTWDQWYRVALRPEHTIALISALRDMYWKALAANPDDPSVKRAGKLLNEVGYVTE